MEEKSMEKVISDNLQKIMKEYRINQAELAKIAGVSESAAGKWILGKSTPRMGAIQKIADKFNLPKSYILEESSATNVYPISPATVRIPILGKIACGDPIDADENIEGFLYKSPEGLPSGDLIALHVKGDSMSPTIPDKAYVIIRRQADAENGELVAVRINSDEDATLKRLKKQGNTIILMPDNQKYDPIVVNEDNPITMIGKVVSYEVRF